jgi:hypothetical protein
MPQFLRDELERAAKQSGKSVTQELLRRLQQSFQQDQEKERDPPLRALLFMIGQLADHVSGVMWFKNYFAKKYGTKAISLWRTDPFKFRAFKFAVMALLDSLEIPAGKLQAPVDEELVEEQVRRYGSDPSIAKMIREQRTSPEAYGRFVAGRLMMMTNLHDVGLAHDPVEWMRPIREELSEHPQLQKAIEREFYGLPQASRDLALKKEENR